MKIVSSLKQIGEILTTEQCCVLCGHAQRRVIANEGRGGQKLTTGICTGCGLVQSLPVPSPQELREYYRSRYRSEYKNAVRPHRKHILRYSRNAIGRLQRLQHFTQAGQKLLDVGSGSGEFVYMARLAEFEASGLEPHEGYSDYTRGVFGIPVQTASLEEAQIAPASLDVVTIHHVVEHLPDPVASLSIINGWLREGGLIAIDVPNIEDTRRTVVNNFHYAHIYNFNHQTLVALLNKTGFELLPHPQHTGTVLVAKKVGAPSPALRTPMPENYQRLWQSLTAPELQRLGKRRSFLRFFQKCWRYPAEYLSALRVLDPRRIAEKEWYIHLKHRICMFWGVSESLEFMLMEMAAII